MSKTFYLAGPMRGYPQYNFPTFHAVAATLRARGYKIISPAEQDGEGVKSLAMASKDGMEFDRAKQGAKVGGETTGEILARDAKILHDHVQGIIFLPGWEKSRGALFEAFTAVNNLSEYIDEFYFWQPDTETLDRVSRLSLLQQVYQAVYAKLVA